MNATNTFRQKLGVYLEENDVRYGRGVLDAIKLEC